MLFYLLVKNHPFENGNKRMAVAIMLTFLYKNGHWTNISPDDLYQVAKSVAESPAKSKDEVVGQLRRTLKDHDTK